MGHSKCFGALITISISMSFSALAHSTPVTFPNCVDTQNSAEQVSQAVQYSPNANQALKDNACGFGGLAQGESNGGNTCAANSGNTGVLQLNNAAIRAAGYTPEEYANLTLQQQVDIWAASVGNSNTSGSYTTLSDAIANGTTIGGITPTTGMLAACFQFGQTICTNDVASLQYNGACTSKATGTRYYSGDTSGLADLDSAGQSICSWGAANQKKIDQASCTKCNTQIGAGGGDLSPGPNDPNLKIPSFA